MTSSHPAHPGTVIHWTDYLPGRGKFFVILGRFQTSHLIALRITSQDHWLRSPLHRAAMVEIPAHSTAFLDKRSFINCFAEVRRIGITEFERALDDGTIEVRGRLRKQYLVKMRTAIDNDLLPLADIEEAIAVIDAALAASA